MKKHDGKIVYSPSDLIRYLASPYASWMDRYHMENPGVLTPDEESEDRKLIAKTGDEHEQAVLAEMKAETKGLIEIERKDVSDAKAKTLAAIKGKAPIIYQAALENDRFFGFADFIILDDDAYQIWDTKLARSPKPYYAIQLCCYSEMFADVNGGVMPEKFGIILGSKDKVEFRVEDYLHYYRRIRDAFLAMQDGYTGKLEDCPEPLPSSDPNAHGSWKSHAEKYFDEKDHLVRVAGMTTGQIKKLNTAGITTATELAAAGGKSVPKIVAETFKKLVAQAKLQVETRADRAKNPNAPARFEVLSGGSYNQLGLASLPAENPADVFFDMEGYPLVSGGLEYLFGACAKNLKTGEYEFHDWWAHDRDEEKVAFEGFVDWAYARWRENPGMHIYHYAAYEVSAVRRLSTRHDTRQDEVDNMLRAEVFVDLYSVVRHGLRIGEDSYSIKKVEHLYRPKRSTEVATAVESIVQYAQWIEGKQPKDWKKSPVLKDIRDYNEDDCKSTDELLQWMRKVAAENGIAPSTSSRATASKAFEPEPPKPEVLARLEVIEKLREKGGYIADTLADLTDFHRREEKPVWWRMFDRAQATEEELRDDSGCIEGVVATGSPWVEKRSQVQAYTFDPQQECKLEAGERDYVKFTHSMDGQLNLKELDLEAGTLQLKVSEKSLNENFGGAFPQVGSLIPIEVVSTDTIKATLTEIGQKYLSGVLPPPAKALIEREAPVVVLQDENEKTSDAAVRVASSMNGGCLVIQGPPGTGKTYTAAHVINALVAAGKKVGVASNGHKAIINLLEACGEAQKKSGGVRGIKVGGEEEDGKTLYADNLSFRFVKDAAKAQSEYSGGIVGGTAWLFVRPEWEDQLDYLFIDEAGQVSLANTIAMSRSTKNIILLGDQMQLKQPVAGTHPGDSGLSGLQYALKDLVASKPDEPAFHAVVPSDYGLFLGESRRMHPSVCTFISDSIYEGRLTSFADCAQQCIKLPAASNLVGQEHGILFSEVEHDGNIQQSEEEVERVKAIYEELLGRPYTDLKGEVKNLELGDFLFIAPYNAQVRALQAALPEGARVGSVDKFQGQQAPVCILSLCSSYGEYGGRGLAFILDRNRVNVAVSRAQCLAVVVADPRIASTPANSLADMKLLNLFCKLVEY